MKTLFLITAMLFISINLNANPPDSCLKYYFHPDTTFTNPDSVMVDSCEGSPTYGVYYGKKYFYLTFNYNIIPRTYLAPADTIIEYTIDNIESQYAVAINEFTQLQTAYGSFKFQEKVPNMPDTTSYYKRFLFIIFDSFVPIKEVEEELNKFSCIESAGFFRWFGVISDIDELISQTDGIILFPNPVSDIIMINGLDETQAQSFSIYNSFGQKLFGSEFINQIDVSVLTPGVYFLRIGNKYSKFVKK